MSGPVPDWVVWAVQQVADRLLPELEPRASLLGCGSFGCTMPTVRPGWVCKVTVDGTEAFFARVMSQIGWRSGFCRYLDPMRVESPAGPVWLIWRSEVQMPSLDDFMRGLAKDLPDYVELIFQAEDSPGPESKTMARVARIKADRERRKRALGIDAEPILREMTQCGLAVAAYVRIRTAQGHTMQEILRDLHESAKRAEPHFRPKDRGVYGWTYGEGIGDKEQAGARLLGYRYQLDRLTGNVLVGNLADGLHRMVDLGVLLCDLNADNIARLDGAWTLYDGGFCVPVDVMWLPLWNEVGPDVLWWWRNQGWDPLAGPKPT